MLTSLDTDPSQPEPLSTDRRSPTPTPNTLSPRPHPQPPPHSSLNGTITQAEERTEGGMVGLVT
ncbi:hypothetical protein HK097_010823, partial [Rhizophlyctis rosea]